MRSHLNGGSLRPSMVRRDTRRAAVEDSSEREKTTLCARLACNQRGAHTWGGAGPRCGVGLRRALPAPVCPPPDGPTGCDVWEHLGHRVHRESGGRSGSPERRVRVVRSFPTKNGRSIGGVARTRDAFGAESGLEGLEAAPPAGSRPPRSRHSPEPCEADSGRPPRTRGEQASSRGAASGWGGERWLAEGLGSEVSPLPTAPANSARSASTAAGLGMTWSGWVPREAGFFLRPSWASMSRLEVARGLGYKEGAMDGATTSNGEEASARPRAGWPRSGCSQLRGAGGMRLDRRSQFVLLCAEPLTREAPIPSALTCSISVPI